MSCVDRYFDTHTKNFDSCVASGTNDLANQGVFDIASTEDPFGERTVGVITKCDISQHKSQVNI